MKLKAPKLVNKLDLNQNTAFVCSDISQLDDFLSVNEKKYLKSKVNISDKTAYYRINKLGIQLFVILQQGTDDAATETVRNYGYTIYNDLKSENISGKTSIGIINLSDSDSFALALYEGIALSAYSYTIKSSEKDDAFRINNINIKCRHVIDEQVSELHRVIEAVYITRDLVNSPADRLNAEQLASFAKKNGADAGYSTDIFGKKKLETLKFGGLLGVNRGSQDSPTFSILEHKPKNAINKKPYVIVGKGVTFDTGGMNLKTPPGSLDTMKCDMGGAASVVGVLTAVASNKLPIHVIGLIPATDNRLNNNAIVPGDVLTMHNGKTVEVLNTDAEGRLILADALSYAQQLNPELVIDLATLTGSAVMSLGSFASVVMGTANKDTFSKLSNSGYKTHERVVEFPFWDDYGKLIESDIADIKNLGGREAGAITAGKFLEHFTSYPWIHIDIAGPAFSLKRDGYRGLGASGVGVRLLYDFFKSIS